MYYYNNTSDDLSFSEYSGTNKVANSEKVIKSGQKVYYNGVNNLSLTNLGKSMKISSKPGLYITSSTTKKVLNFKVIYGVV
jgi:hypothetical protein